MVLYDGNESDELGETVVEESAERPWIGRVVRALKLSSAIQAPEAVLAGARAAFLERHRNPDQTIHVARQLFDSWTNLVPSEVRGELPTARTPGDMASTRHQVYTTAWHDVDLWGERLTEDLWYLIGQILPKAGGAAIRAREALLTSADKSVITGVPENGEFHMPSVRAGLYDLRLRLDCSEVLLPGVRIGL